MGIVVVIAIGLVAGFGAFVLLPLRMHVAATTGLSMAGSVVGAAVSALISEGPWWALRASGVVLSTLGAVLTVVLMSWGQRSMSREEGP